MAAPEPLSSPAEGGDAAPDPDRQGDPAPSGAGNDGAKATARSSPWVVSTYFAEGLPFSIVRQLSAELFTSLGTKPQQIGLTSLYGVAWNFKFLWSPFVERYGTLRRWLIGVQALLGLVVMGVAGPAGSGDVRGVATVLVLGAFLAATHDIAIDGFYMEALPKRAQADLAGVRIAAYRAALLAGKGLLMLAGALQLAGVSHGAAWRITFFAAGAVLVVLAGAHALMLPRPVRHREHVASPGYAAAFVSFVRQPQAYLSLPFIVLYKAGDSLMFNMNAPFLRSLGFDDLARGTLGTAGIVAGIGGALVGGAAIARRGLARTLIPIVAVQSFAIPLYVAIAFLRPGTAAITAVALFEQIAAGIGDSALAVFLMRRCAGEHKTAHFAIASALMTVTSTAAGVSSGFLVARLGYPVFFAVAFAASLPGLALSFFVPRE